MNPAIVLFAIQAGVRLGKKINQVLLDDINERPLFLPIGDLFGSIVSSDAREFFDENPSLIADGGPYYGSSNDEKLHAYKTILGLNQQIGNLPSVKSEAVEIVEGLYEFEQYKERFGSKPVFQRILGTIVEIGIDYAIDNPNILGRDSSSRQFIHAFIVGLDETDFDEGDWDEIACDLFVSGLKIFNNNISLVTSDKRIEVILSGITGALIKDFNDAPTLADQSRRREFFKRISANMLQGTLGAIGNNPEIFIKGNKASKEIIRSTINQIVEGLKDKEDLFTNESIEVIVKSALGAVSNNVDLITDNKIIKQTILKSVDALKNSDKVFSEGTVAIVLQNALDSLGENIETLIDPTNPQRTFLAEAVSAMSVGLSSTLGNGNLKELFSKNQLIELTKIIFKEVAEDPERLLGDSIGDVKKTALAQIIASVSKAFGEDPRKIINGEGALEVLREALDIAVSNTDKLLDLDTDDPTTNVLYKIMKDVVAVAVNVQDTRKLLSRKVLRDILGKVLNTVSGNLNSILGGNADILAKVITVAIELANDTLANQINGKNLPMLIDKLLKDVLNGELQPHDANAILDSARNILKTL